MESPKRTIKCPLITSVLVTNFKLVIIFFKVIQYNSLIAMATAAFKARIFQIKPESLSDSHFMSKDVNSFADFRMPEDRVKKKGVIESLILKYLYLIVALH